LGTAATLLPLRGYEVRDKIMTKAQLSRFSKTKDMSGDMLGKATNKAGKMAAKAASKCSAHKK
jgi:hypothetical protein